MDLKQAMDAVMQGEIDRGEAMGSAICIYQNNREIYSACFGYDSLAQNKKMQKDTIFRMFSMSKPITAAAAYALMEEGTIAMHDAVSNYLPGFRNQVVYTPEGCVPVKREMQIADLLNMTSGLEYPNPCNPVAQMLCDVYQKMETGYPDRMRTTYDFCNALGTYPLLHQPGERWNYSTSADVLGAVIEAAAGRSFGEVLQEKILLPLGMKDTGFFVPEEKKERMAAMTCRKEDGSFEEGEVVFLGMQDRSIKPAFESGGAGLVSTLADYANFCLMLLNDGTLPAENAPKGKAVNVLKPETVRLMRTPSLTENQRKQIGWDSMHGFNYGSLMRILTAPEEAGYTPAFAGEFGWDGWTGNYVMMDPVNQIFFVYMIQQANGTRVPMYNAIKQTIYDCLL